MNNDLRTDSVTRSNIMLRANDSTELFVRKYQPSDENSEETSAPKTLVLVHGAGEHGGRYDHFARLLADHGWCVIADEQLGRIVCEQQKDDDVDSQAGGPRWNFSHARRACRRFVVISVLLSA